MAKTQNEVVAEIANGKWYAVGLNHALSDRIREYNDRQRVLEASIDEENKLIVNLAESKFIVDVVQVEEKRAEIDGVEQTYGYLISSPMTHGVGESWHSLYICDPVLLNKLGAQNDAAIEAEEKAEEQRKRENVAAFFTKLNAEFAGKLTFTPDGDNGVVMVLDDGRTINFGGSFSSYTELTSLVINGFDLAAGEQY